VRTGSYNLKALVVMKVRHAPGDGGRFLVSAELGFMSVGGSTGPREREASEQTLLFSLRISYDETQMPYRLARLATSITQA
jgi:hypothetical protein